MNKKFVALISSVVMLGSSIALAANSLMKLLGCIISVRDIWILLRVGLFRRIHIRAQ